MQILSLRNISNLWIFRAHESMSQCNHVSKIRGYEVKVIVVDHGDDGSCSRYNVSMFQCFVFTMLLFSPASTMLWVSSCINDAFNHWTIKDLSRLPYIGSLGSLSLWLLWLVLLTVPLLLFSNCQGKSLNNAFFGSVNSWLFYTNWHEISSTS